MPKAPHGDPFKPRPSKGDGFSSAGRSMEHIPEGESLILFCYKNAYGMDTYEGAFAMHLRHIEKDLDARTDKHGNLLPVSIILFGMGLTAIAAGVAANL